MIDRTLYSLDSDLIFFPVRHHSPTAARLLRQLIYEIKPAAVLIEGPSDFNDRIDELFLPHQLPIAIYSYIHITDQIRRSAFYPFCVYSPEWQALQAAHQHSIPVKFIDLPLSDRSVERTIENCYSDETLKRSDYIATICEKLGVEDFDAVWDILFEIDPNISIETYLERCHQFCYHLRASDPSISSHDLDREAYMAEQIQIAIDRYPGKILIITGGYHSSALLQSLQSLQSCTGSASRALFSAPQPAIPLPSPPLPSSPPPIAQGIALTPYTYDRLDHLTGYNAGMPNPGFYHTVWTHRQAASIIPLVKPPGTGIAHTLLHTITQALRTQNQTASTADLIAVQTLAQGLADLRGHTEIWRRDLIDGIIGGLVKEALNPHEPHPFLRALYAIFRGTDRGSLAPGTPLPPLVQDIHQRLQDRNLFPLAQSRSITLDLTPNAGISPDRPSSALLHTLRILQIQGIQRTQGTDFTTRSDLTHIHETWRLHWTPDFDASTIEASIYGSTLPEATIAKLQERASTIDRNSEQAALLLLDAALAGVDAFSEPFYQTIIVLIREENNFLSLARSLQHLLYLYRYDEILDTHKQPHIAKIFEEAFQRGLWLLESLGTAASDDDQFLKGIGNLLEAYERSGHLLTRYRSEFVQVLDQVSQDIHQLPSLRGGAIGALWILGETPMAQILATLRYYAQPEKLGDFLTGLFYMAREATQRDSELLLSIDECIINYSNDEFLEALPALRLAFSYFTPREKHSIAKTLIQATENSEHSTSEFLDLPMGAEVAASAIAFESQLFAMVKQYGIRGGQ
jgi:hypothetical protein